MNETYSEIIALKSKDIKERIEAIRKLTDFKTLEYLIISDININIKKSAYERIFRLFPNKLENIKEYVLKNNSDFRKRLRYENEKWYCYIYFGRICIGNRFAEESEIERSIQGRLTYHEKKIYGKDLDYRKFLRKIRDHDMGIENGNIEDYPVLMWSKYNEKWVSIKHKFFPYMTKSCEIPKRITHLYYLYNYGKKEGNNINWYKRMICRFEDGTIRILDLKRI